MNLKKWPGDVLRFVLHSPDAPKKNNLFLSGRALAGLLIVRARGLVLTAHSHRFVHHKAGEFIKFIVRMIGRKAAQFRNILVGGPLALSNRHKDAGRGPEYRGVLRHDTRILAM